MHGTTDWNLAGKIPGQGDIPLCTEGLEQTQAIAQALEHIGVADVISSPLVRALQSAQVFGNAFGVEVARDPRLTDLQVGEWEGMSYSELERTAEFAKFVTSPETATLPGGETLAEVSARATAAVEQAVQDNASSNAIAIVTHPGVARVVIAHYLGLPLKHYQRLHVGHATATTIAFADNGDHPRVLAINWTPGVIGP